MYTISAFGEPLPYWSHQAAVLGVQDSPASEQLGHTMFLGHTMCKEVPGAHDVCGAVVQQLYTGAILADLLCGVLTESGWFCAVVWLGGRGGIGS